MALPKLHETFLLKTIQSLFLNQQIAFLATVEVSKVLLERSEM